jgi:predicted esterase
MGEARLVVAIVDEVLACYGGDAAKVHIAGMSNGGHAAFETMLTYPERFATLLGAPGSFPTEDPAQWASALGDRAVFNGVGSEDDEWNVEVRATHDALVEQGIESVFVEFTGQRHSVGSDFDESVFFEFWTSH